MSKDRNGDACELRKGPWTFEEDNLLIRYVTGHGEGHWNSLAQSAGLKRTGKSCRLRWLNYLKPDIKRGNLTTQEQLLILELHCKWGNRWSKIAQHLPGRTDNEIKNYWRTRVQKQARQLKIDANSKKFLETIRRFWMPRLLEKVEQNSSETSSPSSSISTLETHQKPRDKVTSPLFPKSNIPQVNDDAGHHEENSRSYGRNLQQLSSENNAETFTTGPSVEEDGYHIEINVSETESQKENFFTQCQQGTESDWFDEEIAATLWNPDDFWDFRKP